MNQTFAFPNPYAETAMATFSNPPSLRRYLRHGMLPQLATFEAVLRLHSATRAAEDLCIAQPTLSGHLRKLGETLGVTLFKMRGKRLVPTDAALVLLQASREIFAAFERCEALLADRRADAMAAAERPHRSRSPRRAESRPASSFIMQTTPASGPRVAAYTAADLAVHGRAPRGPGRKESKTWAISRLTAASG
jgi:DNA-binding transcriptional ArsR family regulator